MLNRIPSFSHQNLDFWFRKLGRHAFLVQIGAMDGMAFDPVHPYVKELTWRGLMVEPMPDMFEKLRKTYVHCHGLKCVRAAIAEHDGTAQMTRIDPLAVERNILPAGALGITTLMPHRGVIGGKYDRLDEATWTNIQKYKRQVTVPCCRLLTLLRRHHIKKIDFLMVDAEGADWMIVKQLPLSRFRPRLVYLEFDHLPNRERKFCISHFQKNGYRVLIDSYQQENFLAIRR